MANFLYNIFGDYMGDGYLIQFAFILIYLVFLVVFIIKKKKLIYQAVLAVFFFYLHMLFVLLFLPFPSSAAGLHNIRFTQGSAPAVNLIPLYDIAQQIRFAGMGFEITAFKNIIGNIIAFMPFGFLFPCLAQSFTRFKKFLIPALFVPVGVEMTQFLGSLAMRANWRSADIDDVILNFTGMVIGYYLLKLFVYCGKKVVKVDFLKLLGGEKALSHKG